MNVDAPSLAASMVLSLVVMGLPGNVMAQELSGNAALSVSAAVTEALSNNPEINAAKDKLKVVQAGAAQAGYLEDPQVALQFNGVPFSNPTSFNQSDWNSIGIRQMVPFFGKLGLKEEIAQQGVKVAEQEVRAKEREIISMVKIAYADLFMAQKAIEILREQLEIMRTVIGATEARYRVGRGTQQDVFKALLEQSALMNQLIVAESDSSAAQVRLNTAMFRPPKRAIQVSSNLDLDDSKVVAPGLDQMALANRPELRGAEEEIARSEKKSELADRNRKFPDFMLGWDYMRMPTDMKKDRYGAMVNITIPFSPWTIGKRNYEVEEMLAEVRAARSNREAMRNMTLKQVGELRAKVQAATRSVHLYREGLLTQAELSFRSAMAAYQAGRVEFVNLLEAERTLREVRMGYYTSQVKLVQWLADLERVVGKELQ